LLTQVPDDLDTYTPITLLNGDILYTLDWYESGANTYSGFSRSDIVTKDASLNYARYKSPLPPIDDRKSCDGQGVYILSDGVPSDKTNSSIENVMSAALAGENFSCSDGLTGGVDWNCKSNFAQKLFNPDTNPAEVSIQTAFVGFSSSFNNLSTNDVKNACKMSSR